MMLTKNNGGVLVRIIQAVDGFKAKYAMWPTEIVINEETLSTIREYHLTDEGFRRLNGFVKITPTTDMVVIAKGPGRRAFDYGKEGWEIEISDMSIGQILGFS